MSIPRSTTSILGFGFILLIIPSYKNVDAQSVEEFHLDPKKPLDDQIRHFPPTSRAIKLQSDLKYSEKKLWPLQWYMNEEIFTVENQKYSPSMKIAEMHFIGIKGDGIGVVIIGNTAVNCQHSAIQSRCHAKDSPTSLSMSPRKSLIGRLRKKYKLPVPTTASSGMAGIIGMSDEGKPGGVGVAPKCHIGSVVIQPSSRHGSPEYCSARMIARDTFPPAELFVHAWILPYVDYQRSVVHALEDLSLLNFKDPQTVLKPHVMTCAKNGIRANSCQYNEYANADSMFLFGAVDYRGYLPPRLETCASLFGVVYSDSLGDNLYSKIVTIDSDGPTSFYWAKNFYFDTDPAVGIAGGIIALIIDYFKKKFRRSPSVSDLAFLLAFSLSSETLQDKNMLWFSNGIELMFSPQAGFGLPNMLKVMSLLDTWIPADFPIIYEVTRFTREIEFQCGHDSKRRTITYLGNLVCYFHISNSQARLHIQLVTVQLSAKLVNRGALSVYLISPAGTVSCILEGRPFDTVKKKYNKLLLRSNHFIGEQLGGQWSIRFYTYQENSKPIHSEEILINENKNKLAVDAKKLPLQNEDEHPVDTQKALHPDEDDDLVRFPPSTGSDSESDLSCEDTNSFNYLQRGKQSGDKPAVVKGSDQNTPKKVRFQQDVSPGPNLAVSPSVGATGGNVKSSQLPTEPSSFPREPKTEASSTNGSSRGPASGGESVPSTITRRDSLSSQPTDSQDMSDGSHKPQTSSTTDYRGTEDQFPDTSRQETKPNLEPLVLQPIYRHQTTSESISREHAKHEQVADTSPQLKAASSNTAEKPVPPSSPSLESNAPQSTASVASDYGKTSPVDFKPASPLKSPAPTSSKQNGPKPVSRIKKQEPNLVNLSQIKFRFVLQERLPLKLNSKPRMKDAIEREKNFELLKAWVDFRHYLFAKLDPKKEQMANTEYDPPFEIFDRHVKHLTMLQKNNKIDSVFNVTPDRLNAILGITDSEPAQPIDSVQAKPSPESSVRRDNT